MIRSRTEADNRERKFFMFYVDIRVVARDFIFNTLSYVGH